METAYHDAADALTILQMAKKRILHDIQWRLDEQYDDVPEAWTKLLEKEGNE